ncbi:hypothetical protein QNI16_00115 [Cytophagaceae bacterium YF14B1]|uniref:Competence protein ComEC n=1 Tax=Xanthocytophaga flava TaxID=3048013 RepID=A0AAE3U4V0_9BACT|nr:hypothetical protein [Xanthocytophaga flavus]MDJ1478862.1 hypothetical protein [Xanthocytophaga flavus]
MLLTKFRAFQLESEGSLFSFYKQDTNVYTLIEARLPCGGIDILIEDLKIHNKERVDTLHITSWDTDHCCFNDLVQIINHLRPSLIEVPSYLPSSEEGRLCRNLLLKYDNIHQKYVHNVIEISKEYISRLSSASSWGSSDVLYPSSYDSENKNDMSLIKLFRSAGFNVISLGDCESEEIARRLLISNIFISEVDVLILPHHGADNGFMSGSFLDKVKPKLAVCSSNYDNQYEHPRQNIRDMLSCRGIPLMTTKRGDVIIFHENGSSQSVAYNFISRNRAYEFPTPFMPKKFR